MTTEPTRVRLGLALVAACTTAATFYALLRVAQAMVFKEPDPALVIYSEHAGFVWRALTGGYLGGMAGFVVWVASARHGAAIAASFAGALPFAAALLAAQGVLVP